MFLKFSRSSYPEVFLVKGVLNSYMQQNLQESTHAEV